MCFDLRHRDTEMIAINTNKIAHFHFANKRNYTAKWKPFTFMHLIIYLQGAPSGPAIHSMLLLCFLNGFKRKQVEMSFVIHLLFPFLFVSKTLCFHYRIYASAEYSMRIMVREARQGTTLLLFGEYCFRVKIKMTKKK